MVGMYSIHICEGSRGMWREAFMLGGHTETLMSRHIDGALSIFGICRCRNEEHDT